MHLKRIELCGFKSYRDVTIVDDLDPGYNVIAGQNGSGKSNLFDAIRFLLGEQHRSLRAEDRKGILHVGAGDQVVQAYVEIVFDNSDNRLSVEGEEVALRRTIGSTKDSYFLNNKSVTKADVSHILELAGFSKSNPYYIVEQGKIVAMAKMGDKERLELLKEVAGTSVYEKRRAESVELLRDSLGKRHEIDTVINYINEKQAELETERAELAEYQSLDKQRRAIEYVLTDHELGKVKGSLEEIETLRMALMEKLVQLREQEAVLAENTSGLREALKAGEDDLKAARADKSALTDRLQRIASRKVEVAARVKDLKSEALLEGQSQRALEEELAEVEKKIEKAQAELAALSEPLLQAQTEKAGVENDIEGLRARKNALVERQGRKKSFSSKKDRNAFLQEKIGRLKVSIADDNRAIADSEAASEARHRRIAEATEERKAALAAIEACSTQFNELQAASSRLTAERQEGLHKEHVFRMEGGELSRKVDHATAALNKQRELWDRQLTPLVSMGAKEVMRLSESVAGIHGMLIDLISVDPEYYTAVEVAAGKQLFNMVVEDERVAKDCITHLQRAKKGRMTFAPLARLAPKRVAYPQRDDAIPLSSVIRVSDRFKPAVESIFNKIMLCRSMDVAEAIADEYKLTCITQDGRKAKPKGEFSGGFYDSARSVFTIRDGITRHTRALDELQATLDAAKKQETVLQQRMSALDTERRKLAETHGSLDNDLRNLQSKAMRLERDIKNLESAEAAARAELPRLRGVLDVNTQKLRDLEGELSTDFNAVLTPKETEELRGLPDEIRRLEDLLEDKKKHVTAILTKKAEIEKRLSVNLEPMKEQIVKRKASTLSSSVVVTNVAELLKQAHDESAQLDKEQEALSREIEAKEAAVKELREKVSGLQAELDTYADTEKALNKELEAASTEQNELLAKRQSRIEKREEYSAKLRDIGTVPADVDEFRRQSAKALRPRLATVLTELKRFGHLNKKALTQYSQFSAQREELLKRQEELQAGADAIQRVIDNLDEKKDEAIRRTLKDVSQHFTAVFKELTRNKVATLHWKTTEDEEDEDAPRKSKRPTVDSLVGVGVKTTQDIMSMSGGQNTIIALALIIAIQRTDPAPFYVFDEIDAALDPVYRHAVADLIKKQSESEVGRAQFLVSTFKDEMVKPADKCYGISFKDHQSTVSVKSKSAVIDWIHAEERTTQGAIGDE